MVSFCHCVLNHFCSLLNGFCCPFPQRPCSSLGRWWPAVPSGVSQLQHGLFVGHSPSEVQAPSFDAGCPLHATASLQPPAAACFFLNCVWAGAPWASDQITFWCSVGKSVYTKQLFPAVFMRPMVSWRQLWPARGDSAPPSQLTTAAPCNLQALRQAEHRAIATSAAETGCQLQKRSCFHRRSRA